MEYAFRNTLTRFLLVFTVVAALAALPVSAQVSKGSISGTIEDPSGAAVASAQIRATSQQTGQVAATTSDATGIFRLNLLPVGTYNLEVTKSGFRKTAMSGVTVAAGVDNSLGAVKLELGVATETVEVSAAPPLVQSSEAQVSSTFSTTYLANIPGIQENQGLDNLAVLLPGVASVRDNAFSNTNGGIGFSVNGLRGRNNDQQIDGQNNNDNSVAGPGIFIGNTEFVDQYQVTTNNFGPEYGRNSGSVVNIVTKTGSNNWHGSIFGTESNSVLNTLSNIQKAPTSTGAGQGLKEPPHFNDAFFGATIGGPWVKNKVFFFGGYDTEINTSKFPYSTTNLTPTPAGIAQMTGCYTNPASLQSIAALKAFGPYGVAGGNPTPFGTPAPVELFSPDVPNGTDPDTGDPVCNVEMAGVQRTLPNSSHQYDWITKIDVTGANDTVYGRYLWQKLSFFNQDSFGTAAVGYPNNVPSTGQGLGISWTHKFSDRMINELRLNYSRLRVEFGGNTIGDTIPHQGQLADAVANVTFSVGGLAGYGPATNAPQGRIVNTYQVQDNWNFVMGKHQLKAGVNYTFQRSPNLFLPALNGQYRFFDWTAYARNTPNRVRVALGDPSLDFREHDSFFYFGDDWKITNHLTLNLGLTYSYYGQPANLFHENTVKRQSSSDPLWDPTLSASITTFPSIPAPKTSWGPSAGFAYTPGWGGWLFGEGKTVFRGGYRLSYDPPFYNIYLNISSAAPQVLLQTLTGASARANPIPAVPLGPNVRAALAASLTPGVFDPRQFNQSRVTPDFGPDRVHSWSFGIQREFGTHVAAEARYVGNHGEHLFQTVNGNPDISWLADNFPSLVPSGVTPCANSFVPNTPAPGGLDDTGRIDCNAPAIQRVRTNTGFSWYHGLQTEFRTNNLFNQLTLKSSYTFSKTLDNASEIFSTFAGGGTSFIAQNPLNVKGAEYGISGLDFRHNWVLSFAEALPFYRSQHGVLGHLLGGWGFGGSYAITSGQPYTPTQFFYSFGTGACDGLGCGDFFFNNAFNVPDAVRPFYGNPNAPPASVGAFAGDVCAYDANIFGFVDPNVCGLSSSQLIDWSAYNAALNDPTATSLPVNQISKDAARYILNGAQANAVFGTPFGNVGRNQVRDARTNTANFQVSKMTKWGERVSVTWHMSMINAFNHPNFGYNGAGSTTFGGVDPFIDVDAGLVGIATGFGRPELFDGGHRIIRFGLRIAF